MKAAKMQNSTVAPTNLTNLFKHVGQCWLENKYNCIDIPQAMFTSSATKVTQC